MSRRKELEETVGAGILFQLLLFRNRVEPFESPNEKG